MPPPYRGVAVAAVSWVTVVAVVWQCDGSGSLREEEPTRGHPLGEFLEPVSLRQVRAILTTSPLSASTSTIIVSNNPGG